MLLRGPVAIYRLGAGLESCPSLSHAGLFAINELPLPACCGFLPGAVLGIGRSKKHQTGTQFSVTGGNVMLPQLFLFYQRSWGFGGNIPVVLSNCFHALRTLLYTSQGPELGKEMDPGYRMGPCGPGEWH